MKLYLLHQNDNNNYDTYDSILVCAENEAEAKTITLTGHLFEESEEYTEWARKASAITCKEIGEANGEQTRGVIIASYNAG